MNLGFYEETLTADNQKRGEVLYKLFKISSIIFFIIFAVMVIFTFAIPDFRTAAFIIGAICLIAGILLFVKKDSCIICYDYTFVDGSVRTAKILNNIKRKNGIEFDCSDITKIERTASLNKEYKIYNYSLNDNEKNKIYIYAEIKGELSVIIMEPSEKLLSLILKGNNKIQID